MRACTAYFPRINEPVGSTRANSGSVLSVLEPVCQNKILISVSSSSTRQEEDSSPLMTSQELANLFKVSKSTNYSTMETKLMQKLVVKDVRASLRGKKSNTMLKRSIERNLVKVRAQSLNARVSID